MTNVTAASPKSVFTEDGRYLTRCPRLLRDQDLHRQADRLHRCQRGDGKPFFAYVAHQAPHDPYHLPKDWRNRHVGEYDGLGRRAAGTAEAPDRDGHHAGRNRACRTDVVRARSGRACPREPLRPRQEDGALRRHGGEHGPTIGRLIDHLKKIGEYENTIFIVFGDNGAEGTDLFGMIAGSPGTRDFLFAAINWSQTHPNAWGDPGSFVGYGPMWAQVSMTPFSQFKGWLAEGGIRNALIVSGPGVRPAGSINHGLMHVADLMPTLLEVAGTSYPKASQPDLPPLFGKSWGRCCSGKADSPRTDQDYLAWESSATARCGRATGNCAGSSSRTARATGSVQRRQGSAERNDLAAQNPDKVKALVALWDDYVKANNVILPSRGPYDTLEKDMPQRVTVYRASRR